MVSAQTQPAGPVISSVADSASYNAHIAWGELVTIFGTNLSDGGTYQAQTVPLPKQLGTTQVIATNEPLELLYVNPTQINVRMSTSGPPQNCRNVGGQCADFVVTVNGVTSPVWTNGYSLYAPALFGSGFDCPYLGWPNAGATNVACGLSGTQKPGQFPRPIVTDANYNLITNNNPARLGQPYVLWLTGLGNPGYEGDLRSKFPTLRLELSRCCLPTYFAGGVGDAELPYAGAASGFPGLYQMNFSLSSLSRSGIGYGTDCGGELKIEVWLSVIASSVSAGGGGTGSNELAIPVYISAAENPCGASNTTTAITSSINPSVQGQAVTFTATVVPSAATGTVQFLDGDTVIGNALLSAGTATTSTSNLSPGVHTITATYSGDSNYGSSSGSRTQTVLVSTTTTLTGSPNPSIYGQSLILTATAVPANATGTVTFSETGTLGVVGLTGGVAICGNTASCSTSGLGPGSHTIRATYNGDAKDGSSSATWTQIVKGTTTTTLTSSLNPSAPGQPVTFTATVLPCCTATGSVSFFDGGNLLGTGGLVSPPTSGTAQATFTTSGLSIGGHTITANYPGDASYIGSTSNSLTEVVRPSTTTTITSSANPSTVGQSVVFTVKVSPAAATGTVTVLDGTSTLITNLPLSGGVADLSVPNLSAGTHMITAIYSGDNNHAGSTSAPLTQIVGPKP
jgi:uncharacterized protein (TIGR03437 family)